MSNPTDSIAPTDIGGFLKKYLDSDGKGDMVKIGSAAYDLNCLIQAARVEELWAADLAQEGWNGDELEEWIAYRDARIQELNNIGGKADNDK